MEIKENLCNKRCKSCIYRTQFTMSAPLYVACAYIALTGHQRPCPAGKECDVYVKGRALTDKPMPKVAYSKNCRISTKPCIRCGKAITGTAYLKYCPECAKALQAERNDTWHRELADKKRQEELKRDKICELCGAVYHSETKKHHYCAECRKLSKNLRLKLKEKRNG